MKLIELVGNTPRFASVHLELIARGAVDPHELERAVAIGVDHGLLNARKLTRCATRCRERLDHALTA